MALSPLSPVIQYNIITFGYSTPGEACASLNLAVAVYTQAENYPPMVGMVLYDDESLITPYNGGFMNQWYLLEYNGTTWAAQVDTQGILFNYQDCVTQPTPTQSPSPTQSIGYYVYILGTGSTSTIACSDYGLTPSTLYAPISGGVGPNVGEYLYTISGTPPTNPAPNGYYSNGVGWYLISGGNGQITSADPNGCN